MGGSGDTPSQICKKKLPARTPFQISWSPPRPGGDIPCNHSMIHQRQRRSRFVRFPCFVSSMILLYRNCARLSLSSDSLRALGCSAQGMQAMRCSWLSPVECRSN